MKKAILFSGQGSQYKGMGRDLFNDYPKLTEQASDILGYDIAELCLKDPHQRLDKTQYTQPALYVVNGLAYESRKRTEKLIPDFALGHSLGEYNALLIAGAYDFATGLKLVQARGELMAKVTGGAMAAVIGLTPEEVNDILYETGLTAVEAANFNTPSQLVVSGAITDINKSIDVLSKAAERVILLPVSAAFHSSYMKPAREAFDQFLNNFTFNELTFPVIANSTAKPYSSNKIKQTLSEQISSPVQWVDSIRYLMSQGDIDYIEINSRILVNMVADIQKNATPLKTVEQVFGGKKTKITTQPKQKKEDVKLPLVENESSARSGRTKKIITAGTLGNKTFRDKYGIKYAYLAGAMYRGIASKELVVKMARVNLMSYLGTGGMSVAEIERNIQSIQKSLNNREPYGMNLLCNLVQPKMEDATVELLLKYHIHFVEAAAYLQMTPALVWYRLSGLSQDNQGNIQCHHHVLAKCSRPEVAEQFMSPAPERVINQLLEQGRITAGQAELSKQVPMSDDICVEADSGGHTDMGIATVLLPSMLSLRQAMQEKYRYKSPIHMGLAGGIGTPEAAMAAFIMGADFILTGSINQCTVEAGNSDLVKDMLQEINVQDTDYAPAGDMFEIGAKVQVLKRGVFFPARAKKLYQLYIQYNSLDEIPEKTRDQLQTRFFKKNFDEIWRETKIYMNQQGMPEEIQKAEASPKHKMALVFRWYFSYSGRVAFAGDESNKVDFQVHVGPALGAFNQWVKGTKLENWRERHVDDIAQKIMAETAIRLQQRFEEMTAAG